MRSMAYVPYCDEASVVAVEGRRLSRCLGSWRRFETPASLLKDELDLLTLWLLVLKLLWTEEEDGGGGSNLLGHILRCR
jgi:hypothetical protein